MTKYPINLIFDGIVDLLTMKGELASTSEAGEWKTISILYGGFMYNITTHNNEIINISRIKKEDTNES